MLFSVFTARMLLGVEALSFQIKRLNTDHTGMGKKDIISKRILKTLVRDFATYLFSLPVVEVVLLDTQAQRVEERRADLLAQVTLPGGESFLLHIKDVSEAITSYLYLYESIPTRQTGSQ